MKKSSSSRNGKGRFHPSRISGPAKFRRALDANRLLESNKKVKRGKMFDKVKDVFENR